ncbi:MAG: ABC transporter substrate-binding protein [Muribaculaceae bacterium]|nr:ABC transporter substrate-binding protein [Muribaculaceae bacterium]
MKQIEIKQIFKLIFVSWVLFFYCYISSCTGNSNVPIDLVPGDTLTHHAELLTIVKHPGNFWTVDIKNPWDTLTYLGRYIIGEESRGEYKMPADYQFVKVPVNSIFVGSSVHGNPLTELGCIDKIRCVTDGEFFIAEEIKDLIQKGTIVDAGSSMSPSLEKILASSPDIALISPYQNSGNGILDKTNAVVINMADYMEKTPLARAEWILLLGILVDEFEAANEIFNKVKHNYSQLSEDVEKVGEKPLVITEVPYNGVWYQPGGGSYMAALIRDAGGLPLLNDNREIGSVQMDISNVYNLGHKAQVWLIKTNEPLTYKDVESLTPLAQNINAFKNGNIWQANTSKVPLYDDMAFHPDKVLKDFIIIFHPESNIGYDHTDYYFKTDNL